MNENYASEIAIKGLTFLVSEMEYFDQFAAMSGLSQDDLKEQLESKDFQIAILDFICRDESLLLSFAEHAQIAADLPFKAYQYLSHYH